jgi:hypothetical protein
LPPVPFMRVPALLVAIGLSAAAPDVVHGQTNTRQTPVCWLRPAPLERCRTFLVTEAALEIPVSSTSHQISAGSSEKDFDARFTLSLGLMKNLPQHQAVGVVVGHDVNRDIFRGPTRGEVRFRQWKGLSAIDVSAGLTRKGIQTATGSVDSHGLTGAIGGEWRYIGADARVDLHSVDGRNVIGGFVGARATSVAAPVAALITFGAVAALIIASGAGY